MKWTNEQLLVIQDSAVARILVEAGPGTGKTSVACARVAWLIAEKGIEASQIAIISFTNTAVHEIRNRIKSFLEVPDHATAIRITTLDSLAWRIRIGYQQSKKEKTNFEENILEASDLISSDKQAQEFLLGIRHLIVDEAQDIVGSRNEFVLTTIQELGPECGITIFSDSAQAIYGFSENGDRTFQGYTLPEEIKKFSDSGDLLVPFSIKRLEEVHRTSDKNLKQLFLSGRKLLFESDIPINEIYNSVRRLILELRHSEGLIANKLWENTKVDLEDTFMIFRTRGEALKVGNSLGKKPRRMRLPGVPVAIHPWITKVLWDCENDKVDEKEFLMLYKKRKLDQGGLNADEAWTYLVREGGVSSTRISLRLLTSRLANRNPNPAICYKDYGLSGPIFSSIHASKGRETDGVYLFLPREANTSLEVENVENQERLALDDAKKAELLLEEARVLFVGATRARKKLHVNDDGAYSLARTLNSGRSFSLVKKNMKIVAVEVGRDSDLIAEGLAGRALFDSEASVYEAQKFLWKNAHSVTALKTFSKKIEDGWSYSVCEDDNNIDASRSLVLFHFSPALKSDFFEVANYWKLGSVTPPSYFKYFYSLGTRTLALSPDDEQRDRLYAPWRQNGLLFAPMITGYPKIYFTGRRK